MTDNIFWFTTVSTSSCILLCAQNSFKGGIGFILIFCNICISMETKYFRLWILRKSFNVCEVILIFWKWWSKINSWGWELIIFIKYLFCVIVFQNSHQKSSILIISDSTSIIAFSCQILQGIKWSFFWVLVDKYSELSDWNSKIWFVELIWDVPA